MEGKGLNPQLENYYQKGLAAVEKANYDYAIELLIQVVQSEPTFGPARRALRDSERAKLQKSPYSPLTTIFLKLNCLIPLIMALIYEAMQKPEKALVFYEEVLRFFPDDLSALKKVATIVSKKQWITASIAAYEDLVEVNPKDLDSLMKLVSYCKDLGNIESAKKYLRKLLDIDPNNQEVKKSLKDIEALSTIEEGKWDDQQSYRTKIKPGSDDPFGLDEPNASPTQNLENKLKEDPDNEELLLQLANAYKDLGELKKSHDMFEKLTKLFPDNYDHQSSLFQIKRLAIENQIEKIQAQLQKDPSNKQLHDKLASFQKKKLVLDAQTLQKEIEYYPNDLNIRFKFAMHLLTLQQYDKAIEQFQLSVKDPSKLTASLNGLGLCFKNKKMYDLAVVQFQKAMERISGMNDTAKEIIYNLGSTYELMDKKEEAIEAYKKIYEVDISYRDISDKINQFYQK